MNEDVKKWYENVVCDDLTKIQSQFNNDFSKYAFIVNLASIRSSEACNVAWFTINEKRI